MTDHHDNPETEQKKSHKGLKIGGAILAVFILVGSCGGDDEQATDSQPTEAAESPSEAPERPEKVSARQKVSEAVSDVEGDATVTDESKPKKGQWVIEFEASEGFSGVHVDNSKQKMVEMVLAIHETDVKAKSVGVRATADLQDDYGQVYEDEQVIWSFWEDAYERVAWDREDIEYVIDAEDAADVYVVHPAVQD